MENKKILGLSKSNIIGIIIALVIIMVFVALYFLGYIKKEMLYFFSGIGVVIMILPFFISLILQSKQENEKEQMFLEFARDLVEGVKSGTPISKSIINIKTKDYGALNSHVSKLANQISIGIPVRDALEIFGKDVNSDVIRRAIGLIKEAERSGGKIETILESVAFSVSQIEKLRKERKAAIYTLTVQGYIIFMIFIIIMLVMQYKILPITSVLGGEASSLDIGSGVSLGKNKIDPASIANSFLFLLVAQGFFAGLVIGKISEGSVKAGFKHSFILTALALIISTGARAFMPQ